MNHRLLIILMLFASLLSSLSVLTAQSDTECEAGFRLFEHDYLGSDPICVPEHPERLAVLDSSPLEFVLIQGIKPVATFEYARDLIARSNPNINIDLMGLTENTADVGNGAEINLEVLLESSPDLIIVTAYAASNTGLETFQAIAPTVVFDSPFDVGEYRSSVDFMSDLLNMPSAGDEILAQLDARLDAFKTAISDADTVPEISLTRLRDSIILFIGGSFGDHLIHEAGLIRPEAQQEYDIDFVANENNGWVGIEVSEESLPLVDGEYLFLWTASPSAEVEEEARQLIATLGDDPLWNTLSAFQNEQLFVVGSHWQGFGILEAHTALDDLFHYVADVDPQDIAPNPFVSYETTEEASATELPVVQAGFPELNPAEITQFEIVDETEDTITIKHLYGETVIPRNPQRIVTEMNTAEVLISLGVIPVGYISYEDQGISPIIAEQAPDMTWLPVIEGPNYEQILELEPDLIIGSLWMGTDGNIAEYELMSEIAPTVPLTVWPGLIWKDTTLQFGTLFDQEELAESLIADYDARVAIAQEQIAPVFGDETVSQLLFFGPSAWLYSPFEVYEDHIYAEDSIGWLYYELGLRPGPGIVSLLGADTEEFVQWVEITGEQLPEIQSQHLVVFPNGYSGAEGISEGYLNFSDSPIWQALPAVKADNVYVITGVNKSRGYYTKLDNIEIFTEIVTSHLDDTPSVEDEARATFPVTLTHSLGTIEIPSQPERVVALSIADSDIAYAFGFTPLTIYGNPFAEDGLWPWLADYYDPEQTALLPLNDISLEYILELNPDIILAGGHYNIAELYSGFSDIAPTTAWQDDSFNDTWQEQTLFAGEALGMLDEAHQLIEETERQIASVGDDYPELVGKTFSLSYLHDSSALSTIYRQQDFAVQFFTEIGFELTPALAELAVEEGSFQGALSLETLDMIEADLVVLAFGSPEIQEAYESNPLYQQLPAVQEGRVVVVDLSTVSQLRSPTVLGIRWVLDQLQPAFATLAES